MTIIENFTPLNMTKAPQCSAPIVNTEGDVLTVEVLGDSTEFEIEVLAQVNYHADEFQPLTGLNLTDRIWYSNIIKNGIYQYPIVGVGNFKFDLKHIADGDVSVFCRTTKMSAQMS